MSANRLDTQGSGKFKEILKESEEELYSTFKKLGLSDNQYRSLFNSRIKEKENKRKKIDFINIRNICTRYLICFLKCFLLLQI